MTQSIQIPKKPLTVNVDFSWTLRLYQKSIPDIRLYIRRCARRHHEDEELVFTSMMLSRRRDLYLACYGM